MNTELLTNVILGSGKPWQQQYDINTTQSTDITKWVISGSLPIPLRDSQAIITKNRIYVLGGCNDINPVSTVYTASINNDGELGVWSTSKPLPDPLSNSQVIVIKNRVYLLGGRNNGPVSAIYTAPINSDGTLGDWTISRPLPVPLSESQAVVIKNRIYLIGGWSKGSMSIVYTAPINNDGTLGAWSIGPSLPKPLTNSQAIVIKDKIYLLSGHSLDIMKAVYTASINNDGTLSAWSIHNFLPDNLSCSQAIVTRKKVYLLGGHSILRHSNFRQIVSIVYTAPIDSNGVLGDWMISSPLPRPLAFSQAVIVKNKIHLLGGCDNDYDALSTIYTASISGGLNDYSPYYNESI